MNASGQIFKSDDQFAATLDAMGAVEVVASVEAREAAIADRRTQLADDLKADADAFAAQMAEWAGVQDATAAHLADVKAARTLHPIFAAALAPYVTPRQAPEFFDADSELPHGLPPAPTVVTMDAETRARIDAIKGITAFAVYDNLYDMSRPRADELDEDDYAELPNAAGQMVP